MKLMQQIRSRRPGRNSKQAGRNVGAPERWLSLAGGGAALAGGLRRGGVSGAALGAMGGYLLYRGASGHCAIYSRLQRSTARPEERGLLGVNELRVRTRLSIDRPREMVYRYWRDLENLPNFMRHIKQVHANGNRSHWIARSPLGVKAQWNAEITQDTPNERLAWRSIAGSDIETRGELRFRPSADGRGTELEADMFYRLPGGRLGRRLGGVTEGMIQRDLERFKAMIEQQASTAAVPPRVADRDQGLGRATVTPSHG
jgi:uncharacterized membrane protein